MKKLSIETSPYELIRALTQMENKYKDWGILLTNDISNFPQKPRAIAIKFEDRSDAYETYAGLIQDFNRFREKNEGSSSDTILYVYPLT